MGRRSTECHARAEEDAVPRPIVQPVNKQVHLSPLNISINLLAAGLEFRDCPYAPPQASSVVVLQLLVQLSSVAVPYLL